MKAVHFLQCRKQGLVSGVNGSTSPIGGGGIGSNPIYGEQKENLLKSERLKNSMTSEY